MDKEKLLAPRAETDSGMPEDDFVIPGIGTIRVRGLSRWEMLVAQREQSKGILVYEKLLVHYGMVDPALTEDEVVRWQKASTAGELEPVTRRIAQLSGVMPDSAKEAVKSFRGGSESGVRVLSGAEAELDGAVPASGDVG